MGDRFRGQRRRNQGGQGSGYDCDNNPQAIHINLVIPTQGGQVDPTLNVPGQRAEDRVPFHDRRQLESKLNRNLRSKDFENIFPGPGPQPGFNNYRDQRPRPFPDQRYGRGGERPNPLIGSSPDFYRESGPNNGREFMDDFHMGGQPTNMPYQNMPHPFGREQQANMAYDILPPQGQFRGTRSEAASNLRGRPPHHNLQTPNRRPEHHDQDYRYDGFQDNMARQYPPQAFDLPPYFNDSLLSNMNNATHRQDQNRSNRAQNPYNGIVRGSQAHGHCDRPDFNHGPGDDALRYGRPPAYDSHDFGNGGSYRHGEGRGSRTERGRGGRGQGERGYRGGTRGCGVGRGGRDERGHQDWKEQTEKNADKNKKWGTDESHHGRGGKIHRGRGRGGKSKVGTTESRERSSSTESRAESINSNSTGISLDQTSYCGDSSDMRSDRGRGRGRGRGKGDGRGRRGKSKVGTTESRERSSSTESRAESINSNSTGISSSYCGDSSDRRRDRGRGRGRGRGKGDGRGRGGKSKVGTTESRERSSSTESRAESINSNSTGISLDQTSYCGDSSDRRSNRGRGRGRGRGSETVERGKEGGYRGRGGKTYGGRGRDGKTHESRERSSSVGSSYSLGGSCTGISLGPESNCSGDKEKQKQSKKEKPVSRKDKDTSGDSKKDEPVQTKASITIKKSFENIDQLKKVLEKHFKKEKSVAEMDVLEEATIFSENESVCIVTITSGSKQQTKRLIRNMCQRVHLDLKVPCYFCVSSWKNEAIKSTKVQAPVSGINQDYSKSSSNETQSTSTQPSSKKKTEGEEETKHNTSTKEKTKTQEQTVSKLAITITKAFENNQQLVTFLKDSTGELASKIPEKPASVSLLSALTLCEYVFKDKACAIEISKVLNKVTGVKSTCIFQKPSKKQPKVEKDIKAVIQDAIKQINERVEKELANHASKTCQIEKSLSELQSKLSSESPDTEDSDAQEVYALMDKMREVEGQKKEFEGRIERLKTLLEKTPSHKDVENVLRDVGVECKRLSASLPMYARRADLIQKVRSDQVSIILGETGSGKSTQLVQYLWEEGLAGDKQIVCTQPRKVAALTLAERVSSELVRNVGSLVGYKAGVRQKSNEDTKILFYTDHTLLNECLRDPLLSKYSCIIIDEAHERSIYTDILLGMIKAFLPQRPDLKLIITSATINPEVFIRYFQTAPELRVSGRTFPVGIVYEDSESATPFENYEKKAIEKVIEIHESQQKGDILVFLTSAVEIMRCCEELTNRLKNKTNFVCFPLHGQLPPDEQKKVFKPVGEGKRKIIFSTNCAETSITIDGIKFVVDTGVVNEMRYDPRKNMSSLGTQIISQSSADQRKGRAGRTSSGTCYRLYTEANYDSMVITNQPEILRVHLGQAVLKLAELGVDVRKYDFVESPEQEAIDSAVCVLQELTALSLEDARITEVGRWLSKLPFDPRQSYVVYLGHERGLLYDALTLATLISNGSNMVYRGLNEAEEQVAARTKNRFGSVNGDLFMWYEIYKAWVDLPKNEQTSWCRKNCVNYKVLNLTKQTISEVRQMLTKELDIRFEFNFSDSEDCLDTLGHIIFEANLPSVCHFSGHKRAGYFTASTGHQVHPHPSSNLTLQNHYPEWILYLQLTKTSRDFIRGITRVDESWIQSAIDSGKLPEDFFKVRNHQVEVVFRREIGQTVFRNLVGPRFSKLRPLEESLAESGMTSVVVEAEKDLGTFDVHSSTAIQPEEEKALNKTIDETVFLLRMENEELPLGQDRSGVRALLGEGGSVSAVFMPDQSNKVLISLADSSTTEEIVKSKFSLFGKITACVKFKKGQSWGFIKYSTFHEASNAVNCTQNHPQLKGSLMVNATKQKRSNFEARLSWCRRPIRGRGTAIVRCPPLERCTLNGMTLNILGTVTDIRVSNRDEDDLIIFNTGRAEEPEIKEEILRHVKWDERKKQQLQVNVIRDQVDLSPEKLEKLKEYLVENFASFISADKFSIRFLQPKKGSQNYVAFISFDNAINGFHACRDLRRRGLYVEGQRVNISPDLKTTINIPKAIMQVCKKNFEQLKQAVEEDDIGVNLNFRELPRGDFTADILASDEESMVRMRAAIQTELEGEVIDCSHNNLLKSLLKKQGLQFLHQLDSEIEGIKIMPNVKADKICLFGSQGSVTKAATEINKYLSKLAEGLHEEISLRGQGRPVGLLKALLRQFPDLQEDFVSKFKVQDVFIDYKKHTLSVVGSEEAIGKLKQTIDNIQKNMPLVNKASDADKVLPDCITCMCPIDDSSELYRLESCGHSFCLTCLRMQLGVQIDDKQFPLACAEENCGKPWVWRDIKMCLKKAWISEAKLVDRAVDAFVAASCDSYKFCTSPNCPVPYEVTDSEEGGEFNCPACQVSLCTSCHTAYHPGLTCRQAASHAKDDLTFQQWMRQNASKCKPCPKCSTPVEKIEGCNKMHCKCGAYFCWLCLEKFDDEQKCYAHMAKTHGGFFGD